MVGAINDGVRSLRGTISSFLEVMEIDNPLRVMLFWTKVMVLGPHDCWPWLASVDKKGYGHFTVARGKNNKAHIFSFVLHGGILIPGDHVDHECDNPPCQNPLHLRNLTNAANNARSGSPSAVNARKTHCVRGHPLSGDNLYIRPGTGWRTCLACVAEREGYATRQAA